MLSRLWSMSLTFVLIGAWLLPVAARGQGTPDNTEQLRRQIDELQQKLESLEDSDKQKRGVTQIGNARGRAQDPDQVVRLYDLGDLFAVAPTYEARLKSDLKSGDSAVFPMIQASQSGGGSGGFGGGGFGGGGFSVTDRPVSVSGAAQNVLPQVTESGGNLSKAKATIDTLIDAIQSTINPTQWDDVGGTMSIAPLGNALMVSADSGTHAQIEKLLGLFRKRWGTLRTVSIRAWWLPLNDPQLAALLAEGEGKPKADDEPPPFGRVDAAAWNELLAWFDTQPNERCGYRATITGYNGQTVSAVGGSQSLAVTDVKEVHEKKTDNAQGGAAFLPVTTVIHEGAALQVTPMTNASGRYVVLDIHSRVNTLRDRGAELRKEVVAKADRGTLSVAEAVSVIDRPVLVAQRLSTTLRVPTGETMLIGGMSTSTAPLAGDKVLYLFVKVAVQELRDQPSEEATPDPAGAPAAAAR